MKAIVYTKYGPPDVLQLKEIEKPAPADDQVLVRVHAASLNAYDSHMMRASPFLVRLSGSGFLKPKNQRFGADFAGRIEAVGRNVKQFQPNNEVFGTTIGAFAEYVCARENRLALKPTNMSFEETLPFPWLQSQLFRLFAIREKFSQDKRS